jgi:hypothetical protein
VDLGLLVHREHQCLLRRIPVSSTIFPIASLIRCGRPEFASRRRQYVNVEGWNPLSSNAIPQATFHRRSHRAGLGGLRVGLVQQRLQRQNRRRHRRRYRRTVLPGREQVRELRVREHLTSMLGQNANMLPAGTR